MSTAVITSVLWGLTAGLAAAAVAWTTRAGQTRRVRSPYLVARRHLASRTPQARLLFAAVHYLTRLMEVTVGRRVWSPLSRTYARAGSPGGFLDEELLPCSLLVGFGFASLTATMFWVLFGPLMALLGLVVVGIGPIVLRVALQNGASARQERIRKMLPYLYDMLSMSLHADIGIPEAMEEIALRHQDEPIGEEFMQVASEVRLGIPRRQALENMAVRVDVSELTKFVQSIIQAESSGDGSIAEAMERQADQARTRRWQAIEKQANTASVTVAFPSTLILVGNLLVLMAPFLLRLLETIAGVV